MKRLAILAPILLAALCVRLNAETGGSADGSAPAAGDLLPRPVSPEHFATVLNSSPFQRTLNLSETYTLRGVANIEGEPVATLFNRDSKKTVVVTSSEANESGLQLVDVLAGHDLTGVAAKISFSGEEFELGFEPERIVPIPKDAPRTGESSGRDDKRSGSERHRGPSKQDIDRYKALTEAQREKFRAYIRQTMEKYPNLSREERGNMIRGALSRLADGGEIHVEPAPQARKR